MQNEMLTAALGYAALGWYVIPVHGIDDAGQCTCKAKGECEQPGKHPILAGGYKIGTIDAGIIRRWWETYPLANVGIVCGQVSGLWVLDVDGAEGIATLEEFEINRMGGPLPEVTRARTGSGGLHLVWRWNDGQMMATRIRQHAGIDVKANGHIVAPPSRHVCGRRYTWEVPPGPLQLAPDDLVRWLRGARTAKDTSTGKVRWFPTVQEMLRDGLPQGMRDDGLFHAALTLFKAGLRADEVERFVLLIAAKCDPPFPQEDARVKVEQARKRWASAEPDPALPAWPAGVDGDEKDNTNVWPGFGQATDYALAQRLKAQWLDARPLVGGAWVIYDGRIWVEGEADPMAASAKLQEIIRMESDMISAGQREAVQRAMERARSGHTVSTVLNILSRDRTPGYRFKHDDLNPDDWVLGVQNGVLDLRTGELREYTREDLITRQANTEWRGADADCPVFEETLSMALRDKTPEEKRETYELLQVFFGACLTGVSFKNFLVLHGPGNTGKSTIIESFAWMLGDYAGNAPRGVLTMKRYAKDRHSTDLTEIEGRRFIYAAEPGPDEIINTELIKDITGGTSLTARRLYQNNYTFQTKAKPLIDTNTPLVLEDASPALEERMISLGFLAPVPDERRRTRNAVMSDLKREAPGILAWAWQGLQRIIQAGTPGDLTVFIGDSVRKERRSIMKIHDLLGQWMEDCLSRDDSWQITHYDAWQSYNSWCLYYNVQPGDKRRFDAHMLDRMQTGQNPVGRIQRTRVVTSTGRKLYGWRGVRVRMFGLHNS